MKNRKPNNRQFWVVMGLTFAWAYLTLAIMFYVSATGA